MQLWRVQRFWIQHNEPNIYKSILDARNNINPDFDTCLSFLTI